MTHPLAFICVCVGVLLLAMALWLIADAVKSLISRHW